MATVATMTELVEFINLIGIDVKIAPEGQKLVLIYQHESMHKPITTGFYCRQEDLCFCS